MVRLKAAGVAALICIPVAVGLRMGGPVRIIRRRQRPNWAPIPSKGGAAEGGGKGGGSASSPECLTFESQDKFKLSRMGGGRGQRKGKKKGSSQRPARAKSRSMIMREKLRSKVKSAGHMICVMRRTSCSYYSRSSRVVPQVPMILVVSTCRYGTAAAMHTCTPGTACTKFVITEYATPLTKLGILFF